jgi:hypothetical protein
VLVPCGARTDREHIIDNRKQKGVIGMKLSKPVSLEGGEQVKIAQPHSIPDPAEVVANAYAQPLEPVQPVQSTITIYVRKGDHAKERVISVNPIPAGLDPIGLLHAGFALDGNSATISVDPTTFAYDDDVEKGNIHGINRWTPGDLMPGDWALTWSLTKAVNCIETLLVNWLTELGYRVKFG